MNQYVGNNENLVFQIGLKQIEINIDKMRNLVGANITSIYGSIKSLDGRLSDDARAVSKKNKREGYISLNLKKIVNPKDENSVIQKKIIRSLSHEARHITESESENKLYRLLGFFSGLYKIFFLPLTIICVLEIIVKILFWNKELNIPIYLNILLIFFPALLIFLTMSYFLLDPEEKDARKFSEKAIKDKRWLEIVHVIDKRN
ncbi:hypothetical protein D4R42_00480 [bacterium]|nr:MAG: hypothetical protein D4R42_00480 [bacterium]